MPAREYGLPRTCFETRPWGTVGASTRCKPVPVALRRKGYRRFAEAAGEYGITPVICACKNPDLPGQLCSRSAVADDPTDKAAPRGRQLSLMAG